MAKVEISVPGERIVEEFTALVPQPTVPSTARSPDIGLVEVSQVNPTELVPGPPGPPGPRGSRWTTGDGDPSSTTGNVLGDMYLDDATGDIWTWNGSVWVNTGTNLTPSPPIMLEQIKTVDGSGSGLDADLLDGQDGNWYRDRVNHTGEQPISTVTGLQPALDLKAPIASPTFTGDPKAPTPATGDNDTSIATTAYVKANISAVAQFPEAPVDGLTYGRKNAAWATIVGGAVVSDTAPGAPLQNGQLWYETDTGNTYVWVTDADSSQWVQQNVMPSGGASDNLSTAADMSIGFRTSGNRFVVNDKADMTGSDVMTVSEAGRIDTVSHIVSGPAGHVYSGTGIFTATAAANSVYLSTTGAGTVFLRPNGSGSATGQTAIASSGLVTTGGQLDVIVAAHATGAVNGVSMGGGIVSTSRTVTTAVTHHAFYNPNGSVGYINTTNSATAYNTSSDERLKAFSGPLSGDDAIAVIRADPVRRFTWIGDGTTAVGWGAQTSYAVSSDLASPPPEEALEREPGDEGFHPWGMDQGKRTPYLWAALTHALDRIDQLEARLAALEGGA